MLMSILLITLLYKKFIGKNITKARDGLSPFGEISLNFLMRVMSRNCKYWTTNMIRVWIGSMYYKVHFK